MDTDRDRLRAARARSSVRDGIRRSRAAPVAALAALLLSACAGVTSEVREEDRNTDGDFDGLWEARLVEGRKSHNRFGNWTLKCNSWSERFLFDVDDGRVTLSNVRGRPSTFVGDGGRFRLEVPIASREVSSRESGSIGSVERKLIFNGNLGRETPRVVYTVGEAQYGWGGCNWPLEAKRRG